MKRQVTPFTKYCPKCNKEVRVELIPWVIGDIQIGYSQQCSECGYPFEAD